jgi:hypothetical protein
MSIRKPFLIVALIVCLGGAAHGQMLPFVPLTVEKGFPLEVTLTEKLRFKLNEPVRGKIVDSVFAFDRVVIPEGSEVLGRITGFDQGGTWKRMASALKGDFTPSRAPRIAFDTLVLPDGTRIPIKTGVHFETDAQVRPDVFKNLLWGFSPYRPQSVPTGIRYRATLLEPLQFGGALLRRTALDLLGSQPSTGTIIYARLETALNSRTTQPGTNVQAVLTRPLFSWDDRVIFPIGSRVTGEVVGVRPSGLWHHTGEMTLNFTKIELPASILWPGVPAQYLTGNLSGVQLTPETKQVHISENGFASIVTSKERFVSPALAAVGLSRGFNNSADSFGRALADATGGSVIRRMLGGGPGLGLPAAVAGRMIPPVGIGLGLYSAGRSVFTNILARGPDINFPADTAIQIRVETAP